MTIHAGKNTDNEVHWRYILMLLKSYILVCISYIKSVIYTISPHREKVTVDGWVDKTLDLKMALFV